jgi:hypothetical protein
MEDALSTAWPIAGYLDQFSHNTGETFTAHVSLRDGGPYRARLVRLLSGHPNREFLDRTPSNLTFS